MKTYKRYSIYVGYDLQGKINQKYNTIDNDYDDNEIIDCFDTNKTNLIIRKDYDENNILEQEQIIFEQGKKEKVKHKVYTIEFGIFWFYKNKLYKECKNQPSFLNIKEANEELTNYLKCSHLLFKENSDIKNPFEAGYYIELYENEVELEDYEIKTIEEDFDYPDGTSLSTPIREIFIDNSGKLVQY